MSLQSKVQYVDFGNMEIIDNREILDLPNSLASVKPMASRYVLYGLKPVYTDRSSAGFCQVSSIFILCLLTPGCILSKQPIFI